MSRRMQHAPEEIVAKLRQVEVLTGQGAPVADAIRAIGSRRRIWTAADKLALAPAPRVAEAA